MFFFASAFAADKIRIKGVELVIGRLARINPKAKGQTPESLRVFETSILEGIRKSGFIEKVRR